MSEVSPFQRIRITDLGTRPAAVPPRPGTHVRGRGLAAQRGVEAILLRTRLVEIIGENVTPSAYALAAYARELAEAIRERAIGQEDGMLLTVSLREATGEYARDRAGLLIRADALPERDPSLTVLEGGRP